MEIFRITLFPRNNVPGFDLDCHETGIEGEIRGPHLNVVRRVFERGRIIVCRYYSDGSLESDGQGREFTFDSVVGQFGTEEIVHYSPGSDGPTIIHLPYQSPRAVFMTRTFPLPFPEAVGASQAFGLHQLGAVDVLLERGEGVLHVFDKVEGYSAFVAVGFVVEVDGRGLWVAVWVVFASREETVNGFQVRKTFHAEFGDESSP